MLQDLIVENKTCGMVFAPLPQKITIPATRGNTKQRSGQKPAPVASRCGFV
jgi:hypothetical protein